MSEQRFRSLDSSEWVKGDYRVVAAIRYSADELADRYNVTFIGGEEEGLGPFKEAGFITLTGTQFALISYLWGRPQTTYILSLFDPAPLAKILEEILEALDMSAADLEWTETHR